jgi:hypothetical protein
VIVGCFWEVKDDRHVGLEPETRQAISGETKAEDRSREELLVNVLTETVVNPPSKKRLPLRACRHREHPGQHNRRHGDGGHIDGDAGGDGAGVKGLIDGF